jgi:protein phosphatase
MRAQSDITVPSPFSAHLAFESSGLTHPGVVREHNEDTWFVDGRCGLALVADGVGGHGDGALASQAATRLIARYLRFIYRHWPRETLVRTEQQERVLVRAIAFAHRAMIARVGSGEKTKRRGSTIVGIWAPGGAGTAATIFHVGDSRLYLLRQGKLLQLTRDHSAYEQWCATGKVGAPPSKKYILQALGLSERVIPSLQNIVPEHTDRLLICTDGLSGSVEHDDLALVLGGDDDLRSACDRLIGLGLSHDAKDNLTAVLCRFRPNMDSR